MTYPIKTLSDLTEAIAEHNPEAALIFATADGDIGAGYHVTELKQLKINSIDCGGRLSDWHETQLQLLDGADGQHMKVERFLKIAKHSVAKLPDLKRWPLSFEYGQGNQGLSRYWAAGVEASKGHVRVKLAPDRAQCKPKVDAANANPARASCC